MIFTTRPWSSTAALLSVLLLQNCQLHSVSVIDTDEEGEPAASPSFASAMRERTPSEPMAMQPLALPSASLAVHVSPSSLSTTLPHEQDSSTAPSSRALSPSTFSTRAIVNFSTAPYDLPSVAMPRASYAAPLGNKLGNLSPDGSRVCVSKVEGVLRGMTSGEEEKDSKPPAQQRSTNLASEDDLANKESRAEERREHVDIRRGVLGILLAMAGSEPDEATEFLDVLLVAAQDNNCRQQALEALSKVAQASPGMFSECLPSLRAATEAEDRDVRLLALKTLGEVEWRHYFGEVGPAPDLPGNMGAILDSRCPFWPGKRVRDTHLLVLIPATVNGEPFTLDLLGELIQRPKNGGKKIKYRYYNGTVKAQIGTASPKASYWLLMTRNVLPKSRSKTYANQKKLVAGHAMRTGMPYEPPKALEAATAILVHHVRNGERLYSNNPCTHTRCQEWILHQSNEYFSIVGGFESSGLDVGYRIFYGSSSDVGVAGCRKFF
jgi:hypothetical protein